MADVSTGDVGLFGPDSVTWRIHADPSMLIGGLRTLMIQALHPLAMAGVAQHSDFQADPWGRFWATVNYVTTTTFGDTAAAWEAGAAVRQIHLRVRGIDEVTGRPYRADDPELLLWVHATLVHSFITSYRRYGGRLTDADADRYVDEMRRAGELVGLPRAMAPASLAELRRYLHGVDGLQVTAAAREALNAILAPPMPLPLRPLWAIPAAAAVALLPRWVRDAYGLPWVPPADTLVRAVVFPLFRAANVALPAPPPVRDAWARARAA